MKTIYFLKIKEYYFKKYYLCACYITIFSRNYIDLNTENFRRNIFKINNYKV